MNAEIPTDPYDYTRHAEYYTIPVGLQFQGRVNQTSFGLGAEYHNLLKASTTSYLSERYGVIENIQEKGHAKEVNAFISFKITPQNALKIGAYYREWFFEDSKAVRSGNKEFTEPKNTTQMTGLNFSISF